MIETLPEPIKKALLELNIKELTPVQELTISEINNQEKILAIAETGSGKTLSYLIPLTVDLISLPKNPPKALVIVPTQELCRQVATVFKKLATHTRLFSYEIYGGKSFDEQRRKLKLGANIIFCCPGRLLEHISQETINLTAVKYLVLDEVDELLQMGFYPQLKSILDTILTKNKTVQTLAFSATSSDEVKNLLISHEIQTKEIFFKGNQIKESISEFFCPIESIHKLQFLRFIIKHFKIKSAIIFTNTKVHARELYEQLKNFNYPCELIEGDMSSHKRKSSLEIFKDKKAKFIIATDVLSRGLDLPDIGHVINWSPPLNYDSYVHRSGRTARFKKEGIVITLYDQTELHELIKIFGKNFANIRPKIFKEFKDNSD